VQKIAPLYFCTPEKISVVKSYTSQGNNSETYIPIFARRKVRAVAKHPIPYFILREKLMDDASGKYLVGQLTSATV
jgi:hypothetical protein